MTGVYVRNGPYNNVMFSTARSFARFGLLILGRGSWNGTTVLSDTSYFRQMTTRSQDLNRAYGYLWWLNGTSTFMIPQVQTVFPGMYAPDAPADMFAGLGRDGQICAVVPSQGLVVIRMGQNPGESGLVTTQYANGIFKQLNYLAGTTSTEADRGVTPLSVTVYPNPVEAELTVLSGVPGAIEVQLFASDGRRVAASGGSERVQLSMTGLPPGLYLVHACQGGRAATYRVLRR
jgi:CubicO group peptidase (beta-lactamase class C family)